MPICALCKNSFSNTIKLDGTWHNLSKRKYCLDCSPFGRRNTRKLHSALTEEALYICKCGEKDVAKFYTYKLGICKACHDAYSAERGRTQKAMARKHLGSKCSNCGYDKYDIALDIHHTQADQKDPNFNNMRGWSDARILKELETCILLCKNCHTALHNNLL